jgi:hypothetical protein
MAGPVYEYLSQDHARLDTLLRQSVARPGEVEKTSYAVFRAGLLRHIGMEEKILLPAARRVRGGKPLTIAAQLRRDHAALEGLLVPTPTPEIVRAIRELLAKHNALEEGAGGLYETCEELVAADVPVAPHFDGPRVKEHIQTLLAATRERPSRDP